MVTKIKNLHLNIRDLGGKDSNPNICFKIFYFHGAMAFYLGIQRNVVECQKICRENSDCDHFRYRDGKTLCVLLKTDMKAFQRKYCRDVGTFLAYGNIRTCH